MKRTRIALRARRLPARQRGLTLIELMVAMVISLVLSLAIFAVLGSAEGLKRTTTSVNDINQTGNYAMYTLDKWVRSAGSGFSQAADYSFGCKVFASKSGTQILPAGAAAPAPFASVNPTGTMGEFRLAPIVIAPAASSPGSDTLIVMAGAAGYGETSADFASDSTASQLTLTNSVSYNANDIVLVADRQGAGASPLPCMVQQVSAAASGVVNLAGAYASGTIGSASLTGMTSDSSAINLGNIAGNNPPVFLMIGVGPNNTLTTYDLLNTTATPLLPVADGVFELHALYGVDPANTGTITWVDAGSASAYSLAALMAGNQTATALLQSIKVIRVGLITRTSLPEKTAVAPAALTLFGDLGATLTYTRNLSGAETYFRYRTMETTIPVRNAMLL